MLSSRSLFSCVALHYSRSTARMPIESGFPINWDHTWSECISTRSACWRKLWAINCRHYRTSYKLQFQILSIVPVMLKNLWSIVVPDTTSCNIGRTTILYAPLQPSVYSSRNWERVIIAKTKKHNFGNSYRYLHVIFRVIYSSHRINMIFKAICQTGNNFRYIME